MPHPAVSKQRLKAYRQALQKSQAALKRGDRLAAREAAQYAVQLIPDGEAGWLCMAAASDLKAGAEYAARALELNPQSGTARRAVKWFAERLEAARPRQESAEVRLPEELHWAPAPVERFARRRLISSQALVPALALAVGLVVWVGGLPAGATPSERGSDPVAKASYTPTPTFTPTFTPTPTSTSTPTATNTPTPSATPTPRPNVSFEYSLDPNDLANEGRWIDVDLSTQRVTAYEGAEAVRTFVVSTGTSRHPTVTGQFRIYVKLRATDMAGPGYYLPGVPYTMYFYRGYALHGTYWHSNFGTPMSHGCVNMITDEARWLFDFASVGTLVNVHP